MDITLQQLLVLPAWLLVLLALLPIGLIIYCALPFIAFWKISKYTLQQAYHWEHNYRKNKSSQDLMTMFFGVIIADIILFTFSRDYMERTLSQTGFYTLVIGLDMFFIYGIASVFIARLLVKRKIRVLSTTTLPSRYENR